MQQTGQTAEAQEGRHKTCSGERTYSETESKHDAVQVASANDWRLCPLAHSDPLTQHEVTVSACHPVCSYENHYSIKKMYSVGAGPDEGSRAELLHHHNNSDKNKKRQKQPTDTTIENQKSKISAQFSSCT